MAREEYFKKREEIANYNARNNFSVGTGVGLGVMVGMASGGILIGLSAGVCTYFVARATIYFSDKSKKQKKIKDKNPVRSAFLRRY